MAKVHGSDFFLKSVSHLLFKNVIRGVKEITMMGLGLGPHTYQVLSFTFLILFLTEFDDTSVNSLGVLLFFHFARQIKLFLCFSLIWNMRIKENFWWVWVWRPYTYQTFSLNFHISAFRKEIMRFLQSD